MNERVNLLSLNLTDPDETAALGASAWLGSFPFNITIVAVSVSPLEDDAGATIDIQDDGTDTAIVAVDASDHDVPGEWNSTHVGGTNDPVSIAAGSEIEIDINNAAAANRFDVNIWYLIGETTG
jgi:hypothetical protein